MFKGKPRGTSAQRADNAHGLFKYNKRFGFVSSNMVPDSFSR